MSDKPGPIESFYIWWNKHDAKGELNGVNQSDAEMVWIEAHRTCGVGVRRLRAALHQILEDPEAQILDSHRDDGWAALDV